MHNASSDPVDASPIQNVTSNYSHAPPAIFAESFNTTSNGTSPICSCNQRSVLDIVWSCVGTLFLCTWTAVHPNVPSPGEESWKILWRRLKAMYWTVVAPELILAWAIRQHLGARYLYKIYKGHSPWTMRHAHYLQMGGFHVRKGVHSKVLYPDVFRELLLDGNISFPSVTEADIDDRSKADALSKTIVLVQTFWFIVQCIGRLVQGLPLTQLEVTTLAVTSCAFILSVMWWNKPFDVRQPMYLCLLNGDLESIERTPSVDFTSVDHYYDETPVKNDQSEMVLLDSPFTHHRSLQNNNPVIAGITDGVELAGSEWNPTEGDLGVMSGEVAYALNAEEERVQYLQPRQAGDNVQDDLETSNNEPHQRVDVNTVAPQKMQINVEDPPISSKGTYSHNSMRLIHLLVQCLRFLALSFARVCRVMPYLNQVFQAVECSIKPTCSMICSIIGTAYNAVSESIRESGTMRTVMLLIYYWPIAYPVLKMTTSIWEYIQSNNTWNKNTSRVGMYFAYLSGIRYTGYCPGHSVYHLIISYTLLAVPGATLFGLVHCIAWESHFPTMAERYLWRISAVGVSVMMCSYAFLFLSIKSRRALSIKGYFIKIATATYTVARLYLLIEAVVSLRALPPLALEQLSWSNFLPHI